MSPEQTSSRAALTLEDVAAYLVDNPNIVVDALREYERRQKHSRDAATKALVTENARAIFADHRPSAGEDGGSVVVQFVDYACGYCRASLRSIEILRQLKPDTRIVFIDYPILGASSHLAARAALAAHMQGQYWPLHRALLTYRGPLTLATITSLARELKLDEARLLTDMASETVHSALRSNVELGQLLGVRGTPYYIVNGAPVEGFLDPDELLRVVKLAESEAQAKDG